MQNETFGPNMLQIFCKRLQGMFSKCCEYHARWHGFTPQKGFCHQRSNQLLSAFIYVGLMLGHLELIMLPTLGQIWRGIIFSKEHTCPYKNDPPKSVSLLCEVCIFGNKPCWGHVGPRITRSKLSHFCAKKSVYVGLCWAQVGTFGGYVGLS